MNDFKILKKHYGEEFAKFCRANFPDILESSGTLSTLIMSMFEPSKYLYEDIKAEDQEANFVDYIYSYVPKKEKKEIKDINETPEEIFDKLGYDLIKCETNDDVQSFKKYYKSEEELCTFRDPERIDKNTIFFAIKKNVDEIKRENFTNPERQDEYGTSVMSIQFRKGVNNRISIKNRYNHTVERPDSTFSNDLDNIYPGLKKSFEKYYNLNIKSEQSSFQLENYKKASDGKMYRYNHWFNGIHYCSDNIIIDEQNNVKKLDKDKIELVDYFIIDKQTKEVKLYDEELVDAFPDSIGKIKKVETQKLDNDNKLIKILSKDGQTTELVVNKYGCVEEYKNESVEKLGDNFFYESYIKKFEATKVKEIGKGVLKNAYYLKEIRLPEAEVFGDNFLKNGYNLENIYSPKVIIVGNNVCRNCENINEIDFPELIEVGDRFFKGAEKLNKVNMKKVKFMGHECLADNKALTKVSFASLEKVGKYFLENNLSIQVLDIPSKAIKNSKLEPHIKRVAKKTRIHMDGPLIQRIFPGLKNLNGKQKEQENEENLEM